MQPQMRGHIEKYIDFALSDVQMENYQKLFELLKPYAKSAEDFVLGCILGHIIASVSDWVSLVHHRLMTPTELLESWKVIIRRIPEIRSRILQTLT